MTRTVTRVLEPCRDLLTEGGPSSAPTDTATDTATPGVDENEADQRRAFLATLRQSARDSGVIVGVVALVAFPAWTGFDLLLLPQRAKAFFVVRMAFEIPILLSFLGLLWKRTAQRWPEPLSFTILALPEIAVAWMIPRSEPHLEAYLLGFSLAIYASAFLASWRWQLTAYLFGLTAVATSVCIATSKPHLGAAQIATVAFYLSTAGAIAIAGQLYRNRSGWRQFVTQALLERERTRNIALVAQLDRLSREDDLTEIANRRAWDSWLINEFRRAHRSHTTMAVILVDLDHLKIVNDQFGHSLGDEVLRSGAVLLAGRMRTTDFVGRLGGDEFAIGCPETTLDEAMALADDLVTRARTMTWPSGLPITLSIGVSELRPTDTSPLEVVDRADAALYRAKVNRDAVCSSDERPLIR